MISREAFLQRVGEIADEGPRYRLGGCGRDGTCDCIGLTIGAIRRAGGAWKGTHGSNYCARYELEGLDRTTADTLELGRQVLKAREPGASNNRLPGRYAGHADQRDYYHAGVVTSVEPLVITHSTGTGKASSIKRDTQIGAWVWGGRLKRVDYGASADAPRDAPPVKTAVVVTQNGGPLRLRAKPTKSCGLYWLIPCGAEVTVLETDTGSPGWWRARYGGRTGYCWNLYLAVG